MTDLAANFDPRPFVGLSMAEAIDRLYGDRLGRQIDRWRREVEGQGVASPPADQLRAQLSEWRWRWIDLPRESVAFDAPELPWLRIAPPARNYFDLLVADLDPLLADAAAPLFWALHHGRLGATGIREPEREHGWKRQTLPRGFFEVSRYRIYRNGSRLAEVSRDGEEVPMFGAVTLAATPDVHDDAGGELRPASVQQINAAIKAAYEAAQADGRKPPNVKELSQEVRPLLAAQGLSATERQIMKIGDAPEYRQLRGPVGRTVNRK